MTSLKRFVLPLGALLVALALLPGCGGDSSGPGARDPDVLLLNSCPDNGPLAFFFNDNRQGGDIAYKTVSPLITIPFISGQDGAYDVSVEEPNRSVQYDQQAHLFDQDTTAIVTAVGLKNPTDTNEGLRLQKRLKLLFFPPDRRAPIGNRCRLYVLHGFNRKKDFNNPQIVFQNFGDNPEFQTTPIPYGAFTVLEVDAKTYKANANPLLDNHWVAKDADADGLWAEQSGTLTLDPGGLYIVMISGVEGDAGTRKPSVTFIKVPPKID